MSNMGSSIWYNIDKIILQEKDTAYTGKFPPYFDPTLFPWCAATAANYTIILREYSEYVKRHAVKPYFYSEQSGHTGKWKTIPLMTWGIKRKTGRYFPETLSILQQIPGLVSISFSLLEAGGNIIPHQGDSDAHIRGHLCLKISDDRNLLGFRVNGIEKTWAPGEWLLFCDAYLHEGWNHSQADRLIIIADIIHPEFITSKNYICAKILSGLALNFMAVKFKIKDISRIPKTVMAYTRKLMELCIRILIFSKIRL